MIRKKVSHEKPIIDLTGPDGNSFVLLAMAKGWAQELGLSWEPIKEDMISGDYEHLLEVIEKYFGNYIILER
jgi:hypothetical protein